MHEALPLKRHQFGDVEVTAIGDHFVVSHHQVWLPGLYATIDAARRAVELDPHDLLARWQAHFPTPMTAADLSDG